MYKISVPIICQNIERQGREGILKKLKELDAERVFLAIETRTTDADRTRETMETLKRECEFFRSQGFEVGVWMWTFMVEGEHSFTPVYAVTEEDHPLSGITCAMDPDFIEHSARYVADLAACGVDLIMFDDDFRYGCIGDHKVGCLCPFHVKRINEKVGEQLSRGELAHRILTGGKNIYRDAWIETNGEAFRAFAKRMRLAVDSVNPKVRMGACACLSSWDLDGVNAYELATLLAGNTKPFVRLIGAAYWAARNSWGTRLGDVIEQERMEEVWTRLGEVEIFGEGDCFPRPRTICPAAYLEGMDTALRADGRMDGLLKYAIDYTSSANYENGYVERHLRNKPIYEGIDRLFSGKDAVGVRVYSEGPKVPYMELGETPADNTYLYHSFFSSAARSFAATSIPTTYTGQGVAGACFGESAWSLPEGAREKGLILDGVAAEILQKQGVDVGIRSFGQPVSVAQEIFTSDGERIECYRIKPMDHTFAREIRVESYGMVGDKQVPMTYTYENAEGERFLVLNFDTRVLGANVHTPSTRHYARSRQYAEAVKWLSRGESLPAYAYGNPDLYLLTKKSENGAMAVGLWNFCVDSVLEPKIVLDGAYSEITFLNCAGMLCGDTVTLSELPAYGFAAFEVRK